MKTLFFMVDGMRYCTDLTYEQCEKIGTNKRLLEILKKNHKTDDVVIEGWGEA